MATIHIKGKSKLTMYLTGVTGSALNRHSLNVTNIKQHYRRMLYPGTVVFLLAMLYTVDV